MAGACASHLRVLKADGGASANNLLMQLQSDQLGLPVERPVVAETTALGAGFLAAGDRRVVVDGELAGIWQLDRRLSPGDRDDAATSAGAPRWPHQGLGQRWGHAA